MRAQDALSRMEDALSSDERSERLAQAQVYATLAVAAAIHDGSQQ